MSPPPLSRVARVFLALIAAFAAVATLAHFLSLSREHQFDPHTGGHVFAHGGGMERDLAHYAAARVKAQKVADATAHAADSGSVGSGVIMPKLENATAKAELGRATWRLLHTMTLRFPEVCTLSCPRSKCLAVVTHGLQTPAMDERAALADYFRLTARLYPCGDCAEHFTKLLEKYPPQVCWTHFFLLLHCQRPRSCRDLRCPRHPRALRRRTGCALCTIKSTRGWESRTLTARAWVTRMIVVVGQTTRWRIRSVRWTVYRSSLVAGGDSGHEESAFRRVL